MICMGKKEKKNVRKRNKNDLPVFDSEHDFLKIFTKKKEIETDKKKIQINKHGVQVLGVLSDEQNFTETPSKENFAELLEE